MELIELYEFIQRLGKGKVLQQEPLAKHTSWRIGGPADLLYEPQDRQAAGLVLEQCWKRRIPVTILGLGSNVLVADEGIRGLVLKTRGLNPLEWQEAKVKAGAGLALPLLCQEALKRGLSGLEFAAGIPGSVGGALVMNAGAHGGSMDNLVEDVTTLSSQGELKTYGKEELGFAYRTSVLKNSPELVVETTLVLRPGDPAKSKALMEQYQALRRAKQPLHLPNAGSVFKNPPGEVAGRLIEAVGAKGLRVGDAQVAKVHANFIVNLGQARASDVKTLMEEVQRRVQSQFNILLEREVLFLGFSDNRG